MCWKHEWAMAINNLERAKDHIRKARERLIHRKQRNLKNFERMKSNKKFNYPKMLAPVTALITKNQQGIDECDEIIEVLHKQQDQLFAMVHIYGIKRAGTPKRVYELMGNYPIPENLDALLFDMIEVNKKGKVVEVTEVEDI